jgi:hypothetical protein
MAEVTVLENGVVILGYHETEGQRLIRLHDEETKQRLQAYADGNRDLWKQ